ncbi:MAG: nucleotidyltransferase family protein, partial [Bacteroidales bacterium]|nr:nucleotidyltransferase family protein [Bacteroidales bacterium]
TRLGLRGCILKGTGLAHLYPHPEQRMCGDIDLWIEGDRDSIIEAFRDADYPVYDIIYQEAKVGVFLDTEVEIHFHPSKMYNPFSNARLQRFFDRNAPFRDDAPITYPDARFNAVFCMAHMFRHYMEGGIGLRQMMDYYYILKALAPEDREPVMKALKHLGMRRFTASVMTCVQYCFGLEDAYLLCSPDRILGKKLVNDIIAMGNFGVMDRRNYTFDGETKWATFRRKNKRVFSNLRYYPLEIFWSPFARVSQFVWRKVKGYL